MSPCENNGFQLCAGDVQAAITPCTKVLMINSPNNPTGAVITREELAKIALLAIKHDLLVITDEVYCELIYDENEHVSIASLPDMRERTVVINSLSKTFAMTGWRLGFAAGPAHFIQKMVYLQENLTACASAPAQVAAIYALKTRCNILEMRHEYERRRNMLHRGLCALSKVRCQLPEGAFYMFPNIKAMGKSSQEVADILLEEAGVITVPGSAFGEMGEGYLRLSYANSEDNLAEALRRMQVVLG